MHKIVDGQKVELSKDEEDAFTAEQTKARPARRIGTPREFLALFTQSEWEGFHAVRQQSPAMDLWLSKAVSGDFSLDHPDVATGLAGLVTAGVITPAREAEILSTDFNAVRTSDQ